MNISHLMGESSNPCRVRSSSNSNMNVVSLCLTTRPGDAGAMPRTACYLVIGKGIGQPRQRT